MEAVEVWRGDEVEEWRGESLTFFASGMFSFNVSSSSEAEL